jgi:hypothetical protein
MTLPRIGDLVFAAILRDALAALGLLRMRAAVGGWASTISDLILRSLARRARRLEGWPHAYMTFVVIDDFSEKITEVIFNLEYHKQKTICVVMQS